MKETKPQILFVNGCMRSKSVSRTYALATRFINAYEEQNPTHQIIYLDLSSERIFPLTYFDIDMQSKDVWNKQHYAQQFIRSDKIIMAAPVWNMSCPSVLSTYIEHICLPKTTYERDDTGYHGLCSGKKALYISTMGGVKQPGTPTGAEYIRAAFERLGITDFEEILVEGIDIKKNDAETLLKDAARKCAVLAEAW